MKKFITTLVALLLGLTPVFVLAEEGMSVTGVVHANVGAEATTKPVTVRANASTTAAARIGAMETKARDRGEMEIDRRVTNLGELSDRVSGMKNLSDSDKASISAAISAQTKGLGDLKAKIAADTDADTLKADVKSITDAYRVYALVIPQVRIIAAADRIVSVTRQMQEFGAKLQARISAAQASGADVSAATTAFTDFNAKIADAQTQAQGAVTAISALIPDGGDKTKMAANTKALQDARAKVVAGQKDLQDARKDVDTILKIVKGKPIKAEMKAEEHANASSTTETH